MIPRLKPTFSSKDLLRALLQMHACDLDTFARRFARERGFSEGLFFSSARAALLAFLESRGIRNREVILPAYTCVVVANAVVQSGNRPVFVDCGEGDFLVRGEDLLRKVSGKTAAVIPTALFGFPVAPPSFSSLPKSILRILDFAHFVPPAGKGPPHGKSTAFWSFNHGKPLSTVFGGILGCSNPEFAERVRHIRNRFPARPLRHFLNRLSYAACSLPAFTRSLFPLTRSLTSADGLLASLTHYFDPNTINIPEKSLEQPGRFEAALGVSQLNRITGIVKRRKVLYEKYYTALSDLRNVTVWHLPPDAWPSHFPMLVPNRNRFIRQMIRRGIDVGTLFPYVVPLLPAYRDRSQEDYPHARRLAAEIVNLPLLHDLTDEEVSRILEAVRRAVRD